MRRLIGLIIFLLIALFSIPLIYLFTFGLMDLFNSFQNVISVSYLKLIINTASLVFAVTFSTLILGLYLSWATEIAKIKYAKIWRILLVIPLVIPSYFAGYLFILSYGPKGKLYDFLNYFGSIDRLPDIYGFIGSWLCLTFICFPYVYINICTGLKLVDRKLEHASRVLGKNHFETYIKIILPNIKGSIYAGCVLVALYTLSDFGAVQALQYQTFTLAIYTKYRSFDLEGAASYALILILLSLPIIYYSINMSILNSYKISKKPSEFINQNLYDVKSKHSIIQLSLVFITFISVLIPFAMIFELIFRTNLTFFELIQTIKLDAIYNTLIGSITTSILCVVFALLIIDVITKNNYRLRIIFENLIYFGYTLPGLVIALSFVYFSVNYFFSIYQTWTILILGYIVLFFSTGYGPIRTSSELIGDRYSIASKSLGKNFFETFYKISLPLYTPGIRKGLLNVFILTAKELPVTLVLAPLSFHTLSTVIWDGLEEANFSSAGLAGLLLIIIISIPTYLSIHTEDIKVKFSKNK